MWVVLENNWKRERRQKQVLISSPNAHQDPMEVCITAQECAEQQQSRKGGGEE